MPDSSVGLIGLGTMGRSLAANIGRHRAVVGYDRDAATRADARALEGLVVVDSLDELARMLKPPRTIIVMVPAGSPVDAALGELLPSLGRDDVVIDGGNSHPYDTSRRIVDLASQGVHLLGAGISGGEEGALLGPSIMLGGAIAARDRVVDLLESIAARDSDGDPCALWLGDGGAGHLTKVVHNGIEYAVMQVLAEVVTLLRRTERDADQCADVLEVWGRGRLGGYLVEILTDILRTRDADGAPLLDRVLDVADQKGTGRWAAIIGIEIGMPVPMITEAVFARSMSARVGLRAAFASSGSWPRPTTTGGSSTLDDLEGAVVAATLVAFAEGLDLLRAASDAEGWGIDLERVTRVWRAGSILRGVLLEEVHAGYRELPDAPSVLLSPRVGALLADAQGGLRRTIMRAVETGVPVPVLGVAGASLDALATKRGSGDVIQAMRDRFGAHTFERRDRPRGERFHDAWRG